ncbi:DUF5753 domain-containing protein [Nocardiopsis deserti]|uniref:DUF5753 domain-containing protein n=1 Tax=Nocardiopsis deserti TaxID=2605988 RepID=UPI00123ADF26|nr:DUF5753 domain-containing protein [Nocardiopsis deserti]
MIDSAAAVHEYEIMVFPAYMQTRDHARALIRYAAPWLSQAEADERAKERAERADRIASAPAPRIWTVLDESVLSRRYGSTEVVLEQLEHVVALADSERVSIQFVPASEPRHPGNSGALKLITTDYIPEVLVAESIREGQVITNTVEVANYRMAYTALQGVASSPEQSLARLRAEVTRLRDEQKRLER